MMWAGTGGERRLHLQQLGSESTPAAAKEPKAATVKLALLEPQYGLCLLLLTAKGSLTHKVKIFPKSQEPI